jgi:hypothetical protein
VHNRGGDHDSAYEAPVATIMRSWEVAWIVAMAAAKVARATPLAIEVARMVSTISDGPDRGRPVILVLTLVDGKGGGGPLDRSRSCGAVGSCRSWAG